MLREFEDKENLLSDMESQVDIYRESGKEEAAIRLEDQLSLIHCKFQELTCKFEMFQRPLDYDGKVGRITRQLRDLESNMSVSRLSSHYPESVDSCLHDTVCVFNALTNIKPEVEATIRMGRKLVETRSVTHPDTTSLNIDHLKSLFNSLGTKITESKTNLESAMTVSTNMMTLLENIHTGINKTSNKLSEQSQDPNDIKLELNSLRIQIMDLIENQKEFEALCDDPNVLVNLSNDVENTETMFSDLKTLAASKIGSLPSPEESRNIISELTDLSNNVHDEIDKNGNMFREKIVRRSKNCDKNECIQVSEPRDSLEEKRTANLNHNVGNVDNTGETASLSVEVESSLKRSSPIDSLVDVCSKPSVDEESTPTKIPPPTLPKPKWYTDALKNNTDPLKNNTQVEQITVVSSTLPSPHALTASNNNDKNDDQHSSSTSDTDGASCSSKRNNNIRQSASINKDVKEYQESCAAVLIKLSEMRTRLEEIASESDLGLRIDLINFELDRLEAEVKTTMSRGETLVLILNRQNSSEAESMKENINNINDGWNNIIDFSLNKKVEASELMKDLDQFIQLRDDLLSWMSNTKQEIDSNKSDEKTLESLSRSLELKKSEMNSVNKIGTKLSGANAFTGQETSLKNLNERWQRIQKDLSGLMCQVGRSKKKVIPSELRNKMNRLSEAIHAVNTQLDLSVLTSLKYEKMEEQQDTLDRVKVAIDSLKPNVKKLEKDLELSSGSLSMECFEHLTTMSEKFRKDWATVNDKYSNKKRCLEEARVDTETLQEKVKVLNDLLNEKSKLLRSVEKVSCYFRNHSFK